MKLSKLLLIGLLFVPGLLLAQNASPVTVSYGDAVITVPLADQATVPALSSDCLAQQKARKDALRKRRIDQPATNAGPFSIAATVSGISSGSSTDVATDIGATYAVTNRLSLRSDNILVPGLSAQYFLGGLQYTVNLASILPANKVAFDPSRFQLYANGGAGVVRQAPTNLPTEQHIGSILGGGINWDATGTGKVTVTLASISWLHGGLITGSNGASSSNAVMYSVGISFGW